MSPRITENEWIEELNKHLSKKERPGPEWFTLTEAAKESNKSYSSMKRVVAELSNNGKLDSSKGMLDGRWVTFYKFRKQK